MWPEWHNEWVCHAVTYVFGGACGTPVRREVKVVKVGDMKAKMSRAAVAVSVVATLGFTAACGGDEGKDAATKPSVGGSASAAGDAKNDQDAAGKTALTEAS
jgi:hypothetical protein